MSSLFITFKALTTVIGALICLSPLLVWFWHLGNVSQNKDDTTD